MRWPVLAFLLAATGCASPEVASVPVAPALQGDVPAVGRKLDLQVSDHGTAARLSGVVGRLTLVCVLGPEPTGARVRSCAELAERFGDRVALVGLVTSESAIIEAPFRIFSDPGGAELHKSLELDPGSRLLLVDPGGRVARVLDPEAAWTAEVTRFVR